MERHISVNRTARYQQLGEVSAATRRLWLVAHGYGQLAEYFIRHFAFLHAADPTGTVIVAPEGLSRFYLSGSSGRVGASWMTRADRLTEIDDQLNYLTTLLERLLVECPTDVHVTVLGFSQGTATISRWLAHYAGRWQPQQVVLWAGDFPDDIAPGSARQLVAGLPVTLVVGDQDKYVSLDKLNTQADILRRQGAIITTLNFPGGHTLNADILRQLSGTQTI